MFIPSRKLMNAMVTLATGDATVPQNTTLKGAFIGLLLQNVAYTPDSNDSIVTSKEANYSGYARKPISAWSGPYVGQVNFSLFEGGSQLFAPSDTVTLNTIYGQFYIGSDSTTVLGVELYNNPIPLGNVSVGFTAVPIFGLGNNTAGYGNSIVSN